MATELKCPNCGAVAIAGDGGKCVCAVCKGTFTFVAGEAKLTGVGELDRLQETTAQNVADIEAIKKALPRDVMVHGSAHPAGTTDHDHTDPEEEVADDEEDL